MPTFNELLNSAAVTDSFLRTESPLNSAEAWKKQPGATKIGKCDATNGWTPETAFSSGRDGAYFNKTVKAASKFYAYSALTLKLSGLAESERYFCIWVYGDKTKQNGYRLKAEVTGTNKWTLRIQKMVEGAATDLETVTNFAAETGSGKTIGSFALVVGGGKLMAFFKSGATWVEQMSASDSTYTEGVGALECKGNVFRGTNFKGESTFSLGGSPPSAVTLPATSITQTSAELNCEIDPEELATTFYFEWGLTKAYGNKEPPVVEGSAGSGGSPVEIGATIEGLAPNTTYHFRVVAKNSEGTDTGEDQEFTTDAASEGGTVKVKVGGSVVDVNRWLKTSGGLIPF